jgi:hypothetical protein
MAHKNETIYLVNDIFIMTMGVCLNSDFMKWHGFDFPIIATSIFDPGNNPGENRTFLRAQYS